MKKVWIASILAFLILTVPFTTVVSANEVEDCNCNPTISDSQVVMFERSLDRLESGINLLLLRYSHIPEVKEKCEEILGVINSKNILDEFCEALYELFWYLFFTEFYWYIFFPIVVPSVIILFFVSAIICDALYAIIELIKDIFIR